MFDISDIQQLRVIASLGSISRAAEVLNVSQPTLSKRLSRLEYKLGLALFHREAGGMQPTPAARYIIEAGDGLQAQMRAIQRHVELMANMKEGALHLGVGPIVEQLFFPAVLLDFTRSTENIRVSLRVGTQEQLLQWLRGGEIDVAAGPFAEAGESKDFLFTHIRSEEMVSVVRRGHPLAASRRQMSIADLFEFPSIAPHVPDYLLSAFDNGTLKTFPTIACENYATAKELVLKSNYFTSGPSSLFSSEFVHGTLVKLDVALHLTWSAYCATLPASIHVPVVRKMVDLFSARAAQMHRA